MIGLLFILATSWAGDPLVRPAVPVPRSSAECSQPIPITIGERSDSLIWADGTARCSGVVLPASQLAYLLATEIHRDAIEALHVQDIQILKAELRACNKPAPWVERPAVQRVIGGAVVAVFGLSVYFAAGGV